MGASGNQTAVEAQLTVTKSRVHDTFGLFTVLNSKVSLSGDQAALHSSWY